MECTHCYNSSGPKGGHGTMSRDDWARVIDEAAACNVRRVQFIGGEPTAHPNFAELAGRTLGHGLPVEVFSNLVHVAPDLWDLFTRPGLSLATSYYSDDAEEHNAVTGRRSHTRTRDNIARAVRLAIPIRVGIVATHEGQRVDEAHRDLESLGVVRIHVDHARPFGRGGGGQSPETSKLCGNCGTGKASIDPTGEVSPCVFSTWMRVGSVHEAPLSAIVSGPAMEEANASIRAVTTGSQGCEPDEECTPDGPLSGCNPRN